MALWYRSAGTRRETLGIQRDHEHLHGTAEGWSAQGAGFWRRFPREAAGQSGSTSSCPDGPTTRTSRASRRAGNVIPAPALGRSTRLTCGPAPQVTLGDSSRLVLPARWVDADFDAPAAALAMLWPSGWLSRGRLWSSEQLTGHGRNGIEQVRTHGLWRSLVSALDWGSRGREFKSPQPDGGSAGQGRSSDRPSTLVGPPSWEGASAGIRHEVPGST
jgi:hypothetical protein